MLIISKNLLNYRLRLKNADTPPASSSALAILSSADNITIKNPEDPKNYTSLNPILPEKIIALMQFGRSGTGLLHSLIDGHSEVSTLPSIYLSEYFDRSTWNKIVSGGWGEMANHFIAIYDVLFDASSKVPIEAKSKKLLYNIGYKEGMGSVGDHQDEVLGADKEFFRSELKTLMDCFDELDAFTFFKLVHAAYGKTINDRNKKDLIFYHIHNPDTYAHLNFVRLAPNARWVLMVREPVQSCESWIRKDFMEGDYSACSTRIFTILFEINNSIYQNQKSIGVRLEDLKENPGKTIPAICTWMGIAETESLYVMTAQGKKWWGDPSSPDFKKMGSDPAKFIKSGSYLYLRSGLTERWNELNEFGTYPKMITPLKLDAQY